MLSMKVCKRNFFCSNYVPRVEINVQVIEDGEDDDDGDDSDGDEPEPNDARR